MTYTPRTNLSSSFIISTSVTDGIDPALTGIKTITGIAVNDIPVITNTTAALAGWLTEASTLADGSVIPGTSYVSGTPAASDADPGATQTWSILPVTWAQHLWLNQHRSGQWSVDLPPRQCTSSNTGSQKQRDSHTDL